MKIHVFFHRLVSPFKCMFRFSSRNAATIQPKYDINSIWADEDDEELKQYMRYAKEFFQRPDKENLKSTKSESVSNDLLYLWEQEFNSTVDTLDDELKTPFKCYLQGYAYKKIAESLQMDEETVKSRIEEARTEVRNRLSK